MTDAIFWLCMAGMMLAVGLINRGASFPDGYDCEDYYNL